MGRIIWSWSDHQLDSLKLNTGLKPGITLRNSRLVTGL